MAGQGPATPEAKDQSLLNSGGKPAWLAPDFVGYGDAELFTRRK